MWIPFVKAQAAGNDFVVVEGADLDRAGAGEGSYSAFAQAVCDRHLGLGADGVEACFPPREADADAAIRMFNPDGSEAEISGNGTRAVAAYLLEKAPGRKALRIATKAGVKRLEALEARSPAYSFAMSMGRPAYREDELRARLELSSGVREAVLLNVGNPQCALFVEDYSFDWRALGREIERHPRFPERTNVSFVRVIDPHTIETRIWERGAGETLSSGTGCTGAALAAILTGRADSPLRVVTPAGDLRVRWEEEEATLEGPARIIARGEYFWDIRTN